MSADLKNLSIEELKKLDKLKTQELKVKYNQYKEQQERQKLIEKIKKKESLIKKINVISKRPLKKSKPKPKTKTFDEYFQECIKNNQFHPIHRLICVKLLNELSKNMNKELSKKNQLWMDLETNTLFRENQVFFLLSTLNHNPAI